MAPVLPVEITCILADGGTVTVPFTADLSLLDLRHVLFSLSDIDPDRIHITLPAVRGGATLPPRPESDSSTSLAQAGIHPGDRLVVSDSMPATPHPPPSSPEQNATTASAPSAGGTSDALASSNVAAAAATLARPAIRDRRSIQEQSRGLAHTPDAQPRNPRPQLITREALAEALAACSVWRTLGRAPGPTFARSQVPATATAPDGPRSVTPVTAIASGSAPSGAASSQNSDTTVPTRDQALSPATTEGNRFVARIAGYYNAVMEYEDPALQTKARACVPVEAIRAEVACLDRPCPDAALAKALLTWFKRDFFTWVNSPKCWACNGESECVGAVPPIDSESKHRAGNVELHQCKKCHAQLRFPRYNDPAKLLETRRGRCGEWQQAFTLICISMGLVARAAHDETDHVWTEIWSHKESRWMHADACEDCLDEPHLYESGWGKKLNYVIATGNGCVADVTRRYTKQYPIVLSRRTKVGEDRLAFDIARLHSQAVNNVPSTERAAVISRNKADEEALHGTEGANSSIILPGRQSGSSEWVRSRGEDGGKP